MSRAWITKRCRIVGKVRNHGTGCRRRCVRLYLLLVASLGRPAATRGRRLADGADRVSVGAVRHLVRHALVGCPARLAWRRAHASGKLDRSGEKHAHGISGVRHVFRRRHARAQHFELLGRADRADIQQRGLSRRDLSRRSLGGSGATVARGTLARHDANPGIPESRFPAGVPSRDFALYQSGRVGAAQFVSRHADRAPGTERGGERGAVRLVPQLRVFHRDRSDLLRACQGRRVRFAVRVSPRIEDLTMDFVLPDQGFHWTDLNFLLVGAGHTLLVSILSGAIGTLIGIVLGWLRQASPLIRVITTPYVDITRSVPLIIQLILANSILAMSGAQFSTFWLSIIVLSSSMTVVTAEVVRGALSTVPYAYVRAARSLGMNYFQTLFNISAPLALRTGLSAWVGLLLGLTRDTALVSVVGYVDFMKSAQILISRTNETLPLLLGVGLFYFVICYSVSRYSAHLQKGIAS